MYGNGGRHAQRDKGFSGKAPAQRGGRSGARSRARVVKSGRAGPESSSKRVISGVASGGTGKVSDEAVCKWGRRRVVGHVGLARQGGHPGDEDEPVR